MRIAKIHIENYKSIKSLDYEPGPYSVLIGENNAGKSNILKALNLALGDTWPSERSFSDEDFHNHDTANDIVIQVFFDQPLEEWRNKHKMTVGGVQLTCHALQRKTGKKLRGELTTAYVCIDPKGKTCKYPGETGKYQGAWFDLRVTSELREQIPFIYVGVLREYDRHNPTSRWSVLRKLLNEVNVDFLNDKTTITVSIAAGTKAKVTRKEAFETAVKDAYKYLRTERFTELEERLAKNVADQMGADQEEGSVSLHFESHDPTHAFKTLQLYVDQLGISSPATEVGAGLQSAIVVGIFRTYEELKKEGAIFAIEEPEVFLHPQKARYFETVLRGISAAGNQVLLTTHSPIFVSIDRPEDAALARRSKTLGTTITQASKVNLADNERQALRLMTEFDTQRNELFFAKKVLLVEGMTEKIALPLAFTALGHDINRLGISVIECGGKTKIPLFANVLEALKIPYAVIADVDVRPVDPAWSDNRKQEQEEQNRKHERWNKDISTSCTGGKVFWLNPDFESEMGLPRNEAEKLDKALAMFTGIPKDKVPKPIAEPIEHVIAI